MKILQFLKYRQGGPERSLCNPWGWRGKLREHSRLQSGASSSVMRYLCRRDVGKEWHWFKREALCAMLEELGELGLPKPSIAQQISLCFRCEKQSYRIWLFLPRWCWVWLRSNSSILELPCLFYVTVCWWDVTFFLLWTKETSDF